MTVHLAVQANCTYKYSYKVLYVCTEVLSSCVANGFQILWKLKMCQITDCVAVLAYQYTELFSAKA